MSTDPSKVYNEMLPDLQKIANGFQYRYKHGYVQDWMSDLNECFMDAYIKYDPKKGDLKRWILFKVRRSLLELVRERARRKLEIASPELLDKTPFKRSNFSLRFLLNEVSEDAKTLINMVLSPPLEIVCSKSSMKEMLILFLERIGWAKERIIETFEEIGESL